MDVHISFQVGFSSFFFKRLEFLNQGFCMLMIIDTCLWIAFRVEYTSLSSSSQNTIVWKNVFAGEKEHEAGQKTLPIAAREVEDYLHWFDNCITSVQKEGKPKDSSNDCGLVFGQSCSLDIVSTDVHWHSKGKHSRYTVVEHTRNRTNSQFELQKYVHLSKTRGTFFPSKLISQCSLISETVSAGCHK